MKYRKKPVVIEAFPVPGEGQPMEPFVAWAERVGFECVSSYRGEGLLIATLEGDMRADPGDWIIKGVKGEFYPIKDEIFRATYEPVEA